MAAHNYDGDMLTDEIAQIHRSPGFITSNLVGKSDDGNLIKEFEASHGTVADMWHAHLAGKETSLNPLGLVEALIGAMQHSVVLTDGKPQELYDFATKIRACVHLAFNNGMGTRDLAGPEGLTTEAFCDVIGAMLKGESVDTLVAKYNPKRDAQKKIRISDDVDEESVRRLFNSLDTNGDGNLTYDEFLHGLARINVAPKKGEATRMIRISVSDPI